MKSSVVTIGFHSYESLAPNQIRLLKLWPGQKGDKLECSLVTVSLDDEPEYEVVSYCWGAEEPPCYIYCGSGYVRITTNLESGLKQSRRADKPRILWADQICINQKNIPERSAQVSMMGQIFSKAHCVLVWLGPDEGNNPQAPLAMKIVDLLARCPRLDSGLRFDKEDLAEHGLPSVPSPEWEAFSQFVSLPYFARVWVLQEIALATNVQIFWGETWICFETLQECCASLLQVSSGLPVLASANFLVTACIRKPKYTRSFLGLVDMVRSREAKDPSDLYFAILGIAGKAATMSADYSKSLVEVQICAARSFLEESPRDLSTLSFAGIEELLETSQPSEMRPSWVPSFHDVNWAKPIWRFRDALRADGWESRNVVELPVQGHRKLCNEGVCVTSVLHVKRSANVDPGYIGKLSRDMLDAKDLYLDYSGRMQSPLLDGGPLESCLLSTMLCGGSDHL